MTALDQPIAADGGTAPVVNPFLLGNFAPVDHESTLLELAVEGEIPKDLRGSLLRNGPNPAGAPRPEQHWFAGDGMLHGIDFAEGHAIAYRNRWVRTQRIAETLGFTAAQASAHAPAIQGSGAVHVIAHAGHILALGEAGLPYELDSKLNTLRQYDFAGALSSAMTAHPKLDPISGELLFFGYDFGPVNLRYHRAAPDGTLTHTVPITTPRPTMMHDFGVTQTRIVFMDLPVVFDLDMALAGRSMPFRWEPSHTARLGVMPRDGGDADVRWIEIDPCYVFHPLNCYDDGARIVMDVVRYDRIFDADEVLARPRAAQGLCRWEIDPAAGTVTTRVLDDRPQEFPRVDPRRETLRHRYGYTTEARLDADGGFNFGGLLKHDLKTGTTAVHDVGAGRAASEGVFVPTGNAEDDGYLLATVYDAATRKSDVLVLDARNFSAAPLAVVHLPLRVPFGFHGSFVPAGA